MINNLFVEKQQAQVRYDKCKICENFSKKTSFCKKCYCIMKIKVTLKDAKCPIDKW
jgi:hypothetical protein